VKFRKTSFSYAAALGLLPLFAGGAGDDTAADIPTDSVSQASEGAVVGTLTKIAKVKPVKINARRSLIETNTELLAPLELGDAFQWISENAGLVPLPELTHNLFFNLYNDAATDVFNSTGAAFPHRPCDDPKYQAILNNYPFTCRRSEGDFAVGSGTEAPLMDNWKAIALVNRIDMAPASGEHCGEQRLVMAKETGGGRDFIIFEAQIPNPSPDQGACACAPIADFWANLTNVDDVATRQLELGKAFLFGHPKLQSAGFGPFMAAGNFSIGTGQIRTNNFNQGPWSLREHKLIEWRDVVWPIPFPVTSNLHAPLLADNSTDPRAADCRESFLKSFDSLMSDNPNKMALNVKPECYDAESPNNFNQGNYTQQLQDPFNPNPELVQAVNDRLAELNSNLSDVEVMNRATFAGSCIGCHQESNFTELGFNSGATGSNLAPPSLGFVHVSELSFHEEDCGDGTTCFGISDALTDDFLPHRKTVMQKLISSCSGTPIQPVDGEAIANLFDAEEAASVTGEFDVEALKDEDRARKPSGKTLGGAEIGRGH